MNTHTLKSAIEWSPKQTRENRIMLNPGLNTGLNPSLKLRGTLRLAARAVLALAPALAILVGSAWLVDLPDAAVYLQAMLGAGGFVFLALAVDSETPPAALLQLATGIALPVLAWLSSRAAVEIILVAAALVAVWVAAGILKR